MYWHVIWLSSFEHDIFFIAEMFIMRLWVSVFNEFFFNSRLIWGYDATIAGKINITIINLLSMESGSISHWKNKQKIISILCKSFIIRPCIFLKCRIKIIYGINFIGVQNCTVNYHWNLFIDWHKQYKFFYYDLIQDSYQISKTL